MTTELKSYKSIDSPVLDPIFASNEQITVLSSKTQVEKEVVSTLIANLDLRHLSELRDSAIDEDIIALNYVSASGVEVFSLLYPNPIRLNTGALNSSGKKKYHYLESQRGWICRGIDISTMEPNEWGCFKPDDPRLDQKKQKPIKYEHPQDVGTQLFFLRVSYLVGIKIAENAGEARSYYTRIDDEEVDDLHSEDRGFWQWVLDHNIPIFPTEGAKKAGSLMSAGYCAIGFPGIYGGCRSKSNGVPCIPFLVPQLLKFATADRDITFVFDQDTKPKTIADVRAAITNTGRILQYAGCKVSNMSWTVPVKGVDDLIMAVGEDGLKRFFLDRLPLDDWILATAFSLVEYSAIDVDERYLTNASINLPSRVGKIIAIKSAKGTGKTEFLAKEVQPFLDRGQSILVITHRIQLAKALADRLGINHIEEVKSSEMGALLGYALCIDSLHPNSRAKFDPSAWEESVVVIDECEQVFWHLFNSDTCKNNRAAILNNFSELLNTVARTGGTVYASDADLSKVSIEYIRSLTGQQMPVELIVNSHNPNAGKRKLIVYKNEGQLLKQAYAAIQKGEKILIHCSAQKSKSTYSPQNVETFLLSKFPHLPVLRVDSETVGDHEHPAFCCIANINAVVEKYRVVIASPTIETGISLDGGHFNAVYAIANGVQTVDAFCQTIERERGHVPRHICISTKGMQRIGNGSSNIKSLLKSVHTVYKANYQVLSLADNLAKQDGLSSAHLDSWSCFAARINQGFSDYSGSILSKLESEGYTVNFFGESDSSEPVDINSADIEVDIKAARDVNYQSTRQGVQNSKNPNDLQYKELQKKPGLTLPERHQVAKGKLCRLYLTEDITDALILKDDQGWYPKLQLHYYLSIGREFLRQRDLDRRYQLAPDGQAFKPDLIRSTLSVKIHVLESLDISQFFGTDLTFSAANLKHWHENILQYRLAIKDVFGIFIGVNSTPIQAVQKLLGTLGLKLEYIDRALIDGVRVRRYSGVNINPDERSVIFDRWFSSAKAKAKVPTPSVSSVCG